MRHIYLVAAVFVLFIASCATVDIGSSYEREQKAVSMVNEGSTALLVDNTAVPFVFEGEILLRRSDIEAVWENLAANGFSIQNPEIIRSKRVRADTYMTFAETEEMRMYFGKYIGPSTTVVEIRAANGEFRLLIGADVEGYPQLLGITGF